MSPIQSTKLREPKPEIKSTSTDLSHAEEDINDNNNNWNSNNNNNYYYGTINISSSLNNNHNMNFTTPSRSYMSSGSYDLKRVSSIGNHAPLNGTASRLKGTLSHQSSHAIPLVNTLGRSGVNGNGVHSMKNKISDYTNATDATAEDDIEKQSSSDIAEDGINNSVTSNNSTQMLGSSVTPPTNADVDTNTTNANTSVTPHIPNIITSSSEHKSKDQKKHKNQDKDKNHDARNNEIPMEAMLPFLRKSIIRFFVNAITTFKNNYYNRSQNPQKDQAFEEFCSKRTMRLWRTSGLILTVYLTVFGLINYVYLTKSWVTYQIEGIALPGLFLLSILLTFFRFFNASADPKRPQYFVVTIVIIAIGGLSALQVLSPENNNVKI